MKNTLFSTLLIAFLLIVFSPVCRAQVFQVGSTTLLTVNQNGDSADVNPGNGVCADQNGQCTLRAAIQEANNRPGGTVINFALPLPAVINLTDGQLTITRFISIVGPGAKNLTVQRSPNANIPNFRIFNISGNGLLVFIRNFKIRNGNAGSGLAGGGINIGSGCTADLTEMAISENTADAAGGAGIANAGGLSLSHSLVSANTTTGAGGGILNIGNSSSAVISDSTLTDNIAKSGGGVENNGSLQLANVTITNNSATVSASSIANNSDGNVYTVNSIVGNDNSGAIGSLSGSFNSLGYNLITNASGSTGFSNNIKNDQVSDNNQINPLLGNLTDNGGQTATRALLAGSPAIDRGSNCINTADCGFPNGQSFRLYSDQRTGYRRYVNGTADIGAFEYSAASTSSNGRLTLLGGSNRVPHFSYNSLVILTNARTNAKVYTVINPFGSFRFQNVPTGDVYILEIRGRRAGISQASVLAFDDFPTPISLTGEQNVRIDLDANGAVVRY